MGILHSNRSKLFVYYHCCVYVIHCDETECCVYIVISFIEPETF